jgi:cholestenol delta-isomerase
MSLVTPQEIPNMQPMDWAIVAAGLGLGISAIFFILNLSASKKDKHRVYTLTNFWLVMSGVIHVWIEFNMVFFRNNSSIKAGMDMYAAADWRYGNYNGVMESGTAAMEAITALVDGPLCFLVALAAVQNWGCRHPLQIVLCVMQIYGLVWFVLQPLYSETGVEGHFSSDPFMFWVIAVGCNAPWGIVPPILLAQSLWAASEGLAKKDKKDA